MKTIFTLAFILFSFTYATASPYSGKLSVGTVYHSSLRVQIDGVFFNQVSGNKETFIRDMNPGYHTIKIYQSRGQSQGNRRYDRTQQLIYQGNVYIKPGYHVDIFINRFGKAFVDEQRLDYEYNPGDHDRNDRDRFKVMEQGDFSGLKQTLSHESFESTRLSIAKQSISQNYFSAAQVKELAELFSFESNKLEIAKYAYQHTVDKSNYYILNEVLSFSSSKEELARYLQTSR